MRTILRLALVVLTVAALAGDWPQILGPSRNGTSAETGLVDGWPAKGPEVAWQRPVGDGFAGPVVAAGRLVLFHHVGGDDVVEGLDAATGKPAWKYSYRCSNQAPYGKGDGPL